MATYVFNHQVIDRCLKSDDEMLIDLATDAITHFNDYTETVLNFQDQINAFKQESPDSYRVRAQDLDTKRRNQHNTCLGDVDILNRLAQNEFDCQPFCNLHGLSSAKDANRTDIGDAVFAWAVEHLENVSDQHAKLNNLAIDQRRTQVENDLGLFVKKKELSPEEELMNKYNSLIRDNRFPMVKDKENETYKFIHFLSQKEVTSEEAITNCRNQLKEKHKLTPETLKLVGAAKHQVDMSNLPKEVQNQVKTNFDLGHDSEDLVLA